MNYSMGIITTVTNTIGLQYDSTVNNYHTSDNYTVISARGMQHSTIKAEGQVVISKAW